MREAVNNVKHMTSVGRGNPGARTAGAGVTQERRLSVGEWNLHPLKGGKGRLTSLIFGVLSLANSQVPKIDSELNQRDGIPGERISYWVLLAREVVYGAIVL